MDRLGIDISLNSTGIALQRAGEPRATTWFFQQRSRETSFSYESEKLKIVCVPFDKNADQYLKMTAVAKTLKSILDTLDPAKTQVHIESYAYSATTSCLTQLAEIGGILRWIVYGAGFKHIDVSPSSLKKSFTGSGRATKDEMYESWLTRGLPDLATILKLKNRTDKPAEDIVDAYALTVHEEPPSPKRRKLG
jgi:Holliday junction resolvasome RuvABC endonuclease subunit